MNFGECPRCDGSGLIVIAQAKYARTPPYGGSGEHDVRVPCPVCPAGEAWETALQAVEVDDV